MLVTVTVGHWQSGTIMMAVTVTVTVVESARTAAVRVPGPAGALPVAA